MGCAREGAIYVELIASPDHAASVGLSDADHYGGIAAGIDDARRDGGIEARMLVTAIRNFGVEAAVDIARRHADDRHPYVVGFNLAGDEAGYRRGASSPRPTRSPRASGLGCTVPRRRARRRRVRPPGAHAARHHPHLARRARDRGPGAGGGDRRARASCSRSARPPTSPRRSSRVTKLTLCGRFTKPV